VESHGDDDVGWGKLLIRPPELSGNPSSRVIWEQVRGMDEKARILPIQYLRYLNGSLTCRKILQGASGFTSHPKEVVLRIFIALENLSAESQTENRGSRGKHTNQYITEATFFTPFYCIIPRRWKKYPNNRPYYGSTFL
jgi:hypothetical protein